MILNVFCAGRESFYYFPEPGFWKTTESTEDTEKNNNSLCPAKDLNINGWTDDIRSSNSNDSENKGCGIMTGYNTTQNRMIASRVVISALVLWLAFCGMAAAEQLYVDESGWWREACAFNASGAPISAAVGAAAAGDSIYVYNGTYYEGGGVRITKERITLQGEDANTTTIHGRWIAQKVVYVTGNYVNVSRFIVTGSTAHGHGIYIGGKNCLVSDNTVNSNFYGIRIGDSSDYSIITNNIVTSNGGGIYLSHLNNGVLKNNIVTSNSNGIYLSYSSNNHITENIITSNSHGICLGSASTNNNINENNISDNTMYGIYLDYTADNKIYHNNFINNNKQAYDHHGFNEWDKGSIIGGNHWSDHSCSGNPSNGTEPYNGIDTNAGAVDNYPFEEPNGWVTVPPLFTTTDAAIALQIAAGSRPPDPRWDVSGDGSVTSLDALMILRAAAGAVSL